jgi:hypothetical protein
VEAEPRLSPDGVVPSDSSKSPVAVVTRTHARRHRKSPDSNKVEDDEYCRGMAMPPHPRDLTWTRRHKKESHNE